MRRSLIPLALVCLIGLTRVASAQVTPAAGYTPPDDTQSIRLGAVIYYDWTTTTTPKSTDADGHQFSPTVFNVSRAYINVQGNLSHVVAFRITPDITRDGDAGALNGNLVYRIKYAFAQLNLDEWTSDWKGSWVRLGIQQTPLIDYLEGIYRYRFQGTVFVEREQIGGNLTSSDAGISFHSNTPNNFGEVHFGVYNGEGYSKAEVNQEKAFQIRGTVRPFARGDATARGWRVTFFYDGDHYIANAPRTRFVFDTTFEYSHFNAGYDYLDGHDQTAAAQPNIESRGWSFWITPFLKEKGNGWEGLLRFDNFAPNQTNLSNQEHQRAIVGISYWFPHPGGSATAALMLDWEQLKFANFPSTPPNATQNRIALHGLINF
jgi:hypothetical protein